MRVSQPVKGRAEGRPQIAFLRLSKLRGDLLVHTVRDKQ